MVRERLEYGGGRERRIRELIESPKVMAELLRYGSLPSLPANPGPEGGRPTKMYLLNEAQCIVLVMTGVASYIHINERIGRVPARLRCHQATDRSWLPNSVLI